MSIEHVLELKRNLATAVAASRTEDIKRLLLKLRQEVQPTEDLLKETKIGLSVGKLRQNSSKEVAELAKDIVKKWKNDVGSVKSIGRPEGKSGAESVAPSPSPAPGGSRSPPQAFSAASTPKPAVSNGDVPSAIKAEAKPAPTRKISATANGKARSSQTDGVVFDMLKDSTRDKCMQLIYDALVLDSDAPSELITERAKEIEEAIFKDNDSDTTPAYRNKMRSLYMNLKDKNNPGLRDSVVSGALTAKKLGSMSTADMASEERKAQTQKLLEENLFKARGAGSQQSETDSFKCGRCKQRKCTYYQMQTRSADEPMTTFVTCTVCNNRWKFC